MGTLFNYNLIQKYIVSATLEQPLHVGSSMGDKSEILIHPTDGRPFVQASSIAGAFRDFFETEYGTEETEYLFGGSKVSMGSRIRISDGKLSGNDGAIHMEYRPRVKINRQTGAVATAQSKGIGHESGQKFELLMVGAGEKMTFEMYVYLKKDEADRVRSELLTVLGAVNGDDILFGGQKSNGCGHMKIDTVLYHAFDMTNSEERELWINENRLEEKLYLDLAGKMKDYQSKDYLVTVTGKTEGDIQIKGIALTEFGEKAPDSRNIQNAKNDYIIPGSALKGAVRNRMEMIADYLKPEKKSEIIRRAFGKTKEKKGDQGFAGSIYFQDSVIGVRESIDKMPLRNRIRIDKFTGGVMHGAKFTEKNAAGEITMQIRVKNDEKAVLGLLILAIRDLAVGAFSLGGGANIGKGFMDIDRIEIASQGEISWIDANKKIVEDKGIIAECLKALEEA